jgi:hypothetical protein
MAGIRLAMRPKFAAVFFPEGSLPWGSLHVPPFASVGEKQNTQFPRHDCINAPCMPVAECEILLLYATGKKYPDLTTKKIRNYK